MAAQSYEFTKRQLGRVRVTANAALAAPEGQNLAIRALAPDMITQCDAFEAADRAVATATQAVSKEVTEGEAAVADLRQLFDQLREVVSAKQGISYEAASSFRTPDDFLNAAEDLERTLQSADPDWATPLLARLGTTLEAANKEYTEASAALKALQKTTLEREQVEGAMRPVLVRFRRAVRATYGSRAREYREILDRRSRGATDDPADPAEPASGTS